MDISWILWNFSNIDIDIDIDSDITIIVTLDIVIPIVKYYFIFYFRKSERTIFFYKYLENCKTLFKLIKKSTQNNALYFKTYIKIKIMHD